MIALDTNALSVLFVPGAIACARGSNQPIKNARERIQTLIQQISKAGEKLLVSTPTLSEFLVKVPPSKIQDVLNELQRNSYFKIQAFDTVCAVELAERTARAMASPGGKRSGTQPGQDWAKIKFDRQIMSIALTSGATLMISNDQDLIAIGKEWNLDVKGIEELPLPASYLPPPLLAGLDDSEGPLTGPQHEDGHD